MAWDAVANLKALEEIENGLAKVYSHLSEKKKFSPQVKKFWAAMAAEEKAHGQLFGEMRERLRKDPDFVVEIEMEMALLEMFTVRVNRLLRYVQSDTLTDKEAYSLGAFIEAELDESRYLTKITAGDPAFQARLKRVHADTSRHRMILVNHSRGNI